MLVALNSVGKITKVSKVLVTRTMTSPEIGHFTLRNSEIARGLFVIW
jgi:hypothetical protein